MYYLLILIAAASRLLPHPPNVACVGAIGLFAGCYLAGRRAYLVPVAALLISDVIGHFLRVPGMGLYQPVTMLAVYLGVLAAVPVGRLLAGGSMRFLRIPAGSLAASTLFYLISNFGVWLGGWYSFSLAGLWACYVNAIPFYGYTIVGDLLFSGILFGVWELSRQFQAAPARLSSVSLARK